MLASVESKAKSCVFILLFNSKLFLFNVVLNYNFILFVLGYNTSSIAWICSPLKSKIVLLPFGIRCAICIAISSHKRWVKLTRHLYLCSCETTTTECVEKIILPCDYLYMRFNQLNFHVISSFIIYMLLPFIYICSSHCKFPFRLESLWVEMIHTRMNFRIRENCYGLKW